MPTSIIKFLKGLHLMALSDIDDWNGVIRMEGIFFIQLCGDFTDI